MFYCVSVFVLILLMYELASSTVHRQRDLHEYEQGNNNNNNDNFEIQMDNLILARRPDQVIKQKTWRIGDFAVPAKHRVKLKESEKRDKYINLARELKKNYGT